MVVLLLWVPVSLWALPWRINSHHRIISNRQSTIKNRQSQRAYTVHWAIDSDVSVRTYLRGLWTVTMSLFLFLVSLLGLLSLCISHKSPRPTLKRIKDHRPTPATPHAPHHPQEKDHTSHITRRPPITPLFRSSVPSVHFPGPPAHQLGLGGDILLTVCNTFLCRDLGFGIRRGAQWCDWRLVVGETRVW